MSHSLAGSLTPAVGKRDHIQGASSAVVTLVEYGDYQCPFCGDVHPIIEALQKHFDGQLRFVFRHFPLAKIHAYAQRAAEAAGAPGNFWEMHDYLFEHRQEAFHVENLGRAVDTLGLDRARSVRGVAEHRYASRVQRDVVSGIANNVGGTPTLFINERRNDNNDDFDTLKRKIEEAIMVMG